MPLTVAVLNAGVEAGAPRRTEWIRKTLPGLLDHPFALTVHVLGSGSDLDGLRDLAHERLHRVNVDRVQGFGLQRRLRKLLATLDAQVLLLPPGAPMMAIPDLPTVAVVPDMTATRHPRLSDMRGLLAENAAVAEALLLRPGVMPDQVLVAPMSVAACFTPGDHDSARLAAFEQCGVTEPYLLVDAGRNPDSANLGRVVEAWLESGVCDTHDLVIAAPDDPTRARAEKVVQAATVFEMLEQTGRVIFATVTDDAAPGLYRGAAAMVSASMLDEGRPTTLEAMACGCPVIASNLDSVRARNGRGAVYFDPAATESLAASLVWALRPRFREQLAARALSQAALASHDLVAAIICSELVRVAKAAERHSRRVSSRQQAAQEQQLHRSRSSRPV